MVITSKVELPSEEELTVQEINISTPGLHAASFHLGKHCESVNNEYVLCHQEEGDPRKCINEGKAVTACSMDFFKKVKKFCSAEFAQFATCLDKSSSHFEFEKCRKTQAVFDKCMLDNLNIERPYYGYFCEVKVHHTERPRPKGFQPEFPNPTTGLPEDQPLQPGKFGNRTFF